MERATGRSLDRFFEDWIYGDVVPSVSVGYRQPDAQSVVVRLEQRGTPAEFPLTLKVNYRTGESEEIVVALSERVTERTIPLRGALRDIDANADHAALVRIER
jgi:aminopeptidase N